MNLTNEDKAIIFANNQRYLMCYFSQRAVYGKNIDEYRNILHRLRTNADMK